MYNTAEYSCSEQGTCIFSITKKELQKIIILLKEA